MSYILDALKKNQVEQAPQDVQLQLHSRPKNKIPMWLIGSFAALLLGNLILLLYWTFFDTNGSHQQSAPPTQVRQNNSATMPTGDQPASITSEPIPTTDTTTDTTPNLQSGASTANKAYTETINITSPQPSSESAQIRPPLSSREPNERASATIAIERFKLTALPERDQVLYNEFNYTSHIFTDDARERAVVINGQRLQVEDSFKGLKIVEITETGLVFEENRQGKVREVEVSIFEQWN